MALLSETPSIQRGQPGTRVEGDDLAPLFRLEVNDVPIREDINQFIESVEFESTLYIADLMRIMINNPGLVDDMFADWSAHKAFAPGNEASLFMGYGRVDRPENFVGRVEWTKHMPNFPRDGMPQLEVKGYDISHRMMDGTGIVFNAAKISKLQVTRPVDQADNQGQVFVNTRHSEVVGFIADMYGMEKDIDPTERQKNVVLKKGMKHYEAVKGLANLNNREFFVDWDNRRRKWVLHWKEINREQRPQFVFRYNQGDASTLLDAEPEYGLRETINEATILIFDKKNQRWVSAIQIDDAAGPDPMFIQGGGLQSKATPRANNKTNRGKGRPKSESRKIAQRRQAKDVIDEALENASAFRLAATGFAIDVLPPGERFETAEDAARWLLRWFKSKQDNFIAINGTVVGVETLRAGQCHTLRGLGTRLDGDYFFTRFRHIQATGELYVCEFTANKVITN